MGNPSSLSEGYACGQAIKWEFVEYNGTEQSPAGRMPQIGVGPLGVEDSGDILYVGSVGILCAG